MYNITNEEKTSFRDVPQVCQITVHPTTGSDFTLTEANIKGLAVSRQSLSGDELEIGSACCSQLEMKIHNDGTYNNTHFEGAEIFVQLGTKNGTYIPIGYYTIDNQPRYLSTIDITALDRMVLFDKYVDMTALQSIWTNADIADIVSHCCSQCGIIKYTDITSYPNADYHPSNIPEQDNLTYRQLLIWCCEIMGRCAYIDWNGELRIERYHTNTDITIDESWRFSSDLFESSITITGVQLTLDEQTYLYGTDVYAFDLTDNLLAQSSDILSHIDLVGLTYTPFSAKTLPMPYLYPLDKIAFRKNNVDYVTYLTNISFMMNDYCNIESVGMTAQEKSYATLNPFTEHEKQIIKKVKDDTTRIVNTRTEALLHTNELIANSFGLYTTTVTMPDGSIKIYMHDKPTLQNGCKVFTMNDGAFAWTDNYQGADTVWSSSIDYAGNAMFRFISAIGLDIGSTTNDYHITIEPDTFTISKNNTLVMQIYAGGSTSETEVVMAIPKIVIDNPSTGEKDGYLEVGGIRLSPALNNGACIGTNLIFVD